MLGVEAYALSETWKHGPHHAPLWARPHIWGVCVHLALATYPPHFSPIDIIGTVLSKRYQKFFIGTFYLVYILV